MSCARKGEAWRSEWRLLVGDPRTTLLAGMGVAFYVAGIVANTGSLVFVGPATMVLAVLLPVLAEFSIGRDTLNVKVRENDVPAGFAEFVLVQQSSLLQAAVQLRDGDEAAAEKDVTEALAQAHAYWIRWKGDRVFARAFALCCVVQRVLRRTRRLDAAAAADARRRVVCVLHDDQQMDVPEIAHIVGCPQDEVRRDLASSGASA